MSGPEELVDDEGKWARRDVFIQEFVDEHGEETANRCLDQLIENGPMRQKEVGDDKYVQLTSRAAGYKSMAKHTAKAAKARFLNE